MEWISVKDRLPEKYERVLVSDGKNVCYHQKQSGFNFKGSEGEDLYGGACYDPGFDCKIFENVTHWRPLPQPPRETCDEDHRYEPLYHCDICEKDK